MLLEFSTDLNNSQTSLSPLTTQIPTPVAVTVPTSAVQPPRTIPEFDMHNIRFASPANATIFYNPNLAPIRGSPVGLSLDSPAANSNVVEPKLLEPSTQANQKSRTNPIALAARGKTKSKSMSSAGKENFRVPVG